MDQTLQQLGELLLGSVPTVILLALLYALYTAIVHKPLQRVLAERRSKTEGAVEKSRADIAAAEARTCRVRAETARGAGRGISRAGSAAAGGAAGSHQRAERGAQQGAGAGAGGEEGYRKRSGCGGSGFAGRRGRRWPRKSCGACCSRRERGDDDSSRMCLIEDQPQR